MRCLWLERRQATRIIPRGGRCGRRLRRRAPPRRPSSALAPWMRVTNARLCSVGGRVDAHRRTPLAAVREQRGDLAIEVPVDALEVIDAAGLEQQERLRVDAGRGPDRRRSADRARRRCRRPRAVPLRDDRGASGTAARDRGRARRRAAPRGSPRTLRPRIAGSFTSSPSTRRRNRTSTAPRILAASRCSSSRRATSAARSASGSHVPLEPSVQTQQVDLGAGVGPLGERGAAPELDVVGVGADRQHAAGDREVDAQHHGVGSATASGGGSWASASRSDSSSTSKPSARSSTMRTSRPSRRASAA